MAEHALVVGIEHYETPAAKALQGPSLDALRFALWLSRARKVPSANIVLILNKSNEWKGAAAATHKQVTSEVRAQGIAIREQPTRLAIMKAWREDLLSGPAEPGIVWLYWSGHGVTFPQSR